MVGEEVENKHLLSRKSPGICPVRCILLLKVEHSEALDPSFQGKLCLETKGEKQMTDFSLLMTFLASPHPPATLQRAVGEGKCQGTEQGYLFVQPALCR